MLRRILLLAALTASAHAQLILMGSNAPGGNFDPAGAAGNGVYMFTDSAMATYIAGGACAGFTSPDGLDCAYHQAYLAATSGTHPQTWIHITTGNHLLNEQMILSSVAGNFNTIGIYCDPGAYITANVAMGPMVYHAPGSQGGSPTITGFCNWNMNRLATGAVDIESMFRPQIHDQFAYGIAPGDTRYQAFVFGSAAGSIGDANITNINYGSGTGHSGNKADIRATLSGGHTGFITGWVVGLQETNCTVTSIGTAGTGTPGNYSVTTTGGGFTRQPSVSYTITPGGQLASSCSVGDYGFMGTSAPTVTLAGGAPTGAAITVGVGAGGYNYGHVVESGTGYTYPVIPIITGHGNGRYPCQTMPTTYGTSSPNWLMLTNPPTITYDGTFAPTAVTMTSNTVADQGANCTDQYTTPDGVVHDAPIMLDLYTSDPIGNSISTYEFDSVNSIFNTTAGLNCGILNGNGGNAYEKNHPYGQVRNGICDSGGNDYDHNELDSSADAGFLITNANSTITHTRSTYDSKANYPGSAEVVYAAGSGSGQQFKESISSGMPLAAPQWAKYICPTGPCESAGYSHNYDIADGFSSTDPPHERQPPSAFPFIFNHSTVTSIANTNIYTLSNSVQVSVTAAAVISCDATATGTATLSVMHYTTSNTLKTDALAIDCSVAGAETRLQIPIRAYPNSPIYASLTDSSGVSVSGSVTLVQTTPDN